MILQKNHLFPASSLFFMLCVSMRIFIEMEDISADMFFHQIFWFYSVFLFFALCFRHILRVPAKKLYLLAAGSPLIFIPLVYCHIADVQCTMNYIHMESFSYTFFHMATLLYFHPSNHPMFYELFSLLIGTTALALILSRNPVRSIITSLTAFYGAFLFAGMSWISVTENHPSFFSISSALEPQLFYAFQFFGISLTLLFFIFLPEIRNNIIKTYKNKQVLPGIVAVIMLITATTQMQPEQITLWDKLILIPALSALLLLPFISIKKPYRINLILPGLFLCSTAFILIFQI
ncbi:MAG: hypothetical protein R6W70_03165 [bacterium]